MSFRAAAARAPDGATIGYRAYGDPARPAIVLVHGGLQAAVSFDRLATALADAFAVYVPDRRGRGRSAPVGAAGGSLASEVADMGAVIETTGARAVFGLSSGAVIALATALADPRVTHLALYEPPLRMAGLRADEWAAGFRAALDAGNLAGALGAAMAGIADRGVLAHTPAAVLTRMFELAIRRAPPGTADEPSITELIPTMRYDCDVVAESAPLEHRLGELRCATLLLGGARSHTNLHAINDAIATRLPAARRVELPDIGHTAAANDGRPELVAAELRAFCA